MKLKISVPKAPLPPVELPAAVLPDVSIIRQQHPKIGDKITLLWGSAALQKYLNDLIFDERGDREGFPKSSASALLRIFKEHGKLVSEDHKNAWVNATF